MNKLLTLSFLLALALPVHAQNRTMEILVVCDSEFVDFYGAGTNDRVQEIFNGLSPWYDVDLSITVEVIRTMLFADPDPFTEIDCSDALQEFRAWGDVNLFQAGLEHDHAILLTRKVLTGGSGHAFSFGICSENLTGTLRYSVARDFDNTFITQILVAHEMGHNLGAQHEPLTANPRRIMYPTISSQSLPEFAPLSIIQIMNIIAGTVCMDDPVSLYEWDFVRGDTNDDGTIDITDATNAVDYAFNGIVPFCADACDFNDSGFVDSADIIGILNYVFQQGPPPSAPWPNYGGDVGVDSIPCGGL